MSPFEDPYLINVIFCYNSLNYQGIATKDIYNNFKIILNLVTNL